MANNDIECPVDLVLINERKARLTAAGVLILSIAYLLTRVWAIPVFLTIDFFMRGYSFGRYSLLNVLSEWLIHVFAVKPKLIDQAPKKFSARIGLLFSVAIIILFAIGLEQASLLLMLVITVFALLESSIGFCAGCYVYHFFKSLRKKNVLNSICMVIACLAFQVAIAQTAKESSFTIENYYKIKWGFADEFINLWKANHYPLLKKAIEKGDIISVTPEKPRLHSGEDTRWDFKVTIVFKNSEMAFDENLTEPYKKLIYSDLEN